MASYSNTRVSAAAVLTITYFRLKRFVFTLRGLGATYGDIYLVNIISGKSFFIRRHQEITWTNVDLSPVRASDIYLSGISQEIPHKSITITSLRITYERYYFNSSGRSSTTSLAHRVMGLFPRCVKSRVAHAPGMPGTFYTPPRFSDPDMHHGTCVTHVPWCMPGSLTSGFLWSRWWGKRFRYSRRMRNPQFCVFVKMPMHALDGRWQRIQTIHHTWRSPYFPFDFQSHIYIHTYIHSGHMADNQ